MSPHTMRMAGRIRVDLQAGWLPLRGDEEVMHLFQPVTLWFREADEVLAFLDEHPGVFLYGRHFERRWVQRCFLGRVSQSDLRRGRHTTLHLGTIRAYRPQEPTVIVRPSGLRVYGSDEPIDWSRR